MLINRDEAIAKLEALFAKMAKNRYDRADESLGREVECISEQVTQALRALPTVSDGWEDIAETGRMIDLELKRVTSITVGYKRCKGYFVADAGCEPHAYGDTLVDALRASLGPLPAPPSE